MTHTWHADHETLTAWAAGEAPAVLAASVEAHLLHCETCRRRTASLTSRGTAADSARRWEALADEVDQPRSSSLLRLGLATPQLRAAWLSSLLVLLAIPAVVLMTDLHLPLLMALAPVAPLAAVALSYGRHVDPAGELALAAPVAGLRVVAVRAVLVSLSAVPVGVGGALLIGEPVAVAFGWLLPGAALSALVVLAGTTRLDPATVAAAIGSTWAVVVSWPAATRRTPVHLVEQSIASAPMQLTALAVALVAITLTLVRRDAVAYRRTA